MLAAAHAAPPTVSSRAQYFTSPEQEAAGKASGAVPGQAGYNEQDEFHDRQGKYKLS